MDKYVRRPCEEMYPSSLRNAKLAALGDVFSVTTVETVQCLLLLVNLPLQLANSRHPLRKTHFDLTIATCISVQL